MSSPESGEMSDSPDKRSQSPGSDQERRKASRSPRGRKRRRRRSGNASGSERRKSSESPRKRRSRSEDRKRSKSPLKKAKMAEKQLQNDLLTTRTGGAYIPPAKLRLMQDKITDKSSIAFQRLAWEALKKSINGLINKVNSPNIGIIVRELFAENIVRGRGLLCQSIMIAQIASPTFTHVYAGLASIINTKFPNIGELLLKRLIINFKRGFKRNDKTRCTSASRFLAHLVNQQVAHEVLALEILTLLLQTPTDDSVEVAISFLKECGQKLTEVSPRGIHAIFDRLRNVLHESTLDKRTQYMIEVMFQVRKDGFKDNPAIVEELDLVEEDDQFTHMIGLDDATTGDDVLNVFKHDLDYEDSEEKYQSIRKELLDEESSGSSDSGSGSDSDSEDNEKENEDTSAPIIDQTETNMIALRRTIYLTIQSSLDFEEAVHKLMKLNLKPGHEPELCHMIIDCCAQQRTYEKFFGLMAQRLCTVNKAYIQPFQDIFEDCYSTVHRLEIGKLRNVARVFAHLFFTDAISWEALACIHLNEHETTSSSRIFIKILYQELAEYMGLQKLNDRIRDATLQTAFDGLFPRDDPANTRFSINFFTNIGLGALTEDLRNHLKSNPKPVAKVAPMIRNGSGSSSSSSSSDSSSDSEDEKKRRKKKKKKMKKKAKKSKKRKRKNAEDSEDESEDDRKKSKKIKKRNDSKERNGRERNAERKRRERSPDDRDVERKRSKRSPEERNVERKRREKSPEERSVERNRRDRSPDERKVKINRRDRSPDERSVERNRRDRSPDERSVEQNRRDRSPDERKVERIRQERNIERNRRDRSPDERSVERNRRDRSQDERKVERIRQERSHEEKNIERKKRDKSPDERRRRDRSPDERSVERTRQERNIEIKQEPFDDYEPRHSRKEHKARFGRQRDRRDRSSSDHGDSRQRGRTDERNNMSPSAREKLRQSPSSPRDLKRESRRNEVRRPSPEDSHHSSRRLKQESQSPDARHNRRRATPPRESNRSREETKHSDRDSSRRQESRSPDTRHSSSQRDSRRSRKDERDSRRSDRNVSRHQNQEPHKKSRDTSSRNGSRKPSPDSRNQRLRSRSKDALGRDISLRKRRDSSEEDSDDRRQKDRRRRRHSESSSGSSSSDDEEFRNRIMSSVAAVINNKRNDSSSESSSSSDEEEPMRRAIKTERS